MAIDRFPHAKHPLEKLDYSYDFGPLVGEVELSNPTVVCDDAALIITNVILNGTVVSCFAAGGEAGVNYGMRFGVDLADGRNFERTVVLPVRER